MRGVTSTALWLLLAVFPAWGLSDPGRANRPAAQTLQLKGTTRQIFREIERTYGRTVVVDVGVRRRSLDFRLERADFATALRITTTLAGAFWVERPDGSILILEDTKANREQFIPQVIQSFPLTGYTDEEIAEIVRILREQIDPPHLVQNLQTSSLIIRDTPRRLQVAAALLEQWAARKEEIVLDVLVLEVDLEEARRMGILPPDQAVLVHIGAGVLPTDDPLEFLRAVEELVNQGVLPAVLLTDRFDFTQGVGVVGIGGGLTEYIASLPGASLTLEDIYKVTRSLRKIRLRATSGTEATFFAGAQFPVQFTTFSIIFIPQIIQDLIDAGTFVPPVPAVRHEELGLKLTVAARVHHNRDVSLAIVLESTQLVGESINSIPIIGNRKLEQQVRVKEGEPFVLSGIRGVERFPIRVGWPVLGSIPVLGRLFSRKETRVRETEFLVMVTPHLVRGSGREGIAQQALYVGTETDFAPVGRGGGRARSPAVRPGRRPAQPRRTQPQQPFQPQQRQQPQQRNRQQ